MSEALPTPDRGVFKQRLFIGGLIVAAVVFLGALAFAFASRGSTSAVTGVDEIHGNYGQVSGRREADSVNGTSVLARMFEQRGHTVVTWDRLSPKIEKFDTIVWAPDDFKPPAEEQRQRLEKWLYGKSGRTLVYIGRDWDAELAYWKAVQPAAPPDQAAQFASQLAQAQQQYDLRRAEMPKQEFARWFTVHGDKPHRDIRTLQGPWSREINRSKVEIELTGVLAVPTKQELPGYDDLSREVLLSSGGDPLVTRVSGGYGWARSKIIVVANGSFLLNLGLVNYEHRKLAGTLIDECGRPGEVLFLESGPDGVEVRESESTSQEDEPMWLKWAGVWPLNAVIYHVAAFGIVLCFALFPIFGRPRQPDKESPSDFGKHVEALGDLLARTQDRGYAQGRVAHYEEKVRRDSGVSHAEARRAARQKLAVLWIEIRLPDSTLPSATDLNLRQRFEASLEQRRVGKIASVGAGLGKMELTLQVENIDVAKATVEMICTELGIQDRTTVTRR